MRAKIILHVALSFFFSALLIVVINIFYMQSSVYRDKALYHYDPQPRLEAVKTGLFHDGSDLLSLEPHLKEQLERSGGGIQILDNALHEVLRAGTVPEDLQTTYTPAQLVALYGSETATTFVSDLDMDRRDYTLLMFLEPTRIKRMLYTYDVKEVGKAYNISWLIGMNILLLLLISYFFTYSISRPLHRIADRILSLSQGRYELREPGRGFYFKVEEAMNKLAAELKTSQQERAFADTAREEWIANLSHDIKTPLTTMMGYAELLGDTDYQLDPDKMSEYKELILEKGRYIKTLLADLNLATRLKHHQYPLKRKTVDLIELIKRELINALNTPRAADCGHTVEFTHTHDQVALGLDSQMFERAFSNLILNAFVHNEKPVVVKVHVDAEDSVWRRITIDDNGVGVEAEELHHIFSRYYRGTRTTTESEGSGLGLAIAKNIIEAHQGTIAPEISPRGGLKITLHLRRDDNETLS